MIESKESVEITDLGKSKKRVGIHTDITFEITAGGDAHDNKTSREHDVDEKGFYLIIVTIYCYFF